MMQGICVKSAVQWERRVRSVLRHILPCTLSAICAQREGTRFAQEQKLHICSEFSTVHLNAELIGQIEQQP